MKTKDNRKLNVPEAEDFARESAVAIEETATKPKDPDMSNVDRNNPFTFTPPHRCTGCGQKTKNMNEKNGKGWLIIPICPGVMLYICVLCHTVLTNQEALYNTKVANVLIREVQEKRIIVPNIQSMNAGKN